MARPVGGMEKMPFVFSCCCCCCYCWTSIKISQADGRRITPSELCRRTRTAQPRLEERAHIFWHEKILRKQCRPARHIPTVERGVRLRPRKRFCKEISFGAVCQNIAVKQLSLSQRNKHPASQQAFTIHEIPLGRGGLPSIAADCKNAWQPQFGRHIMG